MADQARNDFKQVALTQEGRIARLPQAEREAITKISRNYDKQRGQLARDQSQRRDSEIAAERAKLVQEHAQPRPRPKGAGPPETSRQRANRIDKTAAQQVDARNNKALADIDKRKNQDIEKRIAEGEQRQAKRARDLEKAAQMAREFERASRERENSR